jgi:hypothetical protein
LDVRFYNSHIGGLLFVLVPWLLTLFVDALFLFVVPVGFLVGVWLMVRFHIARIKERYVYDNRDRPLTPEGERPWKM